MSDLKGYLCAKRGEIGPLCFCSRKGDDAGKLVYKANAVSIEITWGEHDADLDICAYWIGYRGDSEDVDDKTGKVGFGWNSKVKTEDYFLRWYGDITGFAGKERLIPAILPNFEKAVNRRLRIHLNFYGKGDEQATGRCNFSISSADGSETVTLENIACSTRTRRKADITDKSISITFDKNGKVSSIT